MCWVKGPTGLGHLTRAPDQRLFYVASAFGNCKEGDLSNPLPSLAQVPGVVNRTLSQDHTPAQDQAQNNALAESEFGPAIARKAEEGNDLTMGDEPIPQRERKP